TMEWLGGTCYRFVSPRGRVLLTNPWATEGDIATALGTPPKADIVLIAGGAEQASQVAQLAAETGARVVRPRFGGSRWPEADFEPDRLTQDVSPGDQLTMQGITVCIVGTGERAIPRPAAADRADGVPVGFVVTFQHGAVTY